MQKMVNGYDTRVRKLVQHFESMEPTIEEVGGRDGDRGK